MIYFKGYDKGVQLWYLIIIRRKEHEIVINNSIWETTYFIIWWWAPSLLPSVWSSLFSEVDLIIETGSLRPRAPRQMLKVKGWGFPCESSSAVLLLVSRCSVSDPNRVSVSLPPAAVLADVWGCGHQDLHHAACDLQSPWGRWFTSFTPTDTYSIFSWVT